MNVRIFWRRIPWTADSIMMQDLLTGLGAGFGSASADIFLTESLRIPAERISGGGLTPATDIDLLLIAYRGGSHLPTWYTEQKDGIILHTYSIDADTAEKASDIIQTYYDYLCLDKDLRELEYTFRKDESTGTFCVNRYSYESMVAVMRGGYDEETGYFIMCSMRAEE